MATREILVLGAGHSSPFLIRHLLTSADEHGWRVTVADADRELAAARLADHPRGRAVGVDADRVDDLGAAVAGADLVVNMLPQRFQPRVARECVRRSTPMLCASYASPELLELDAEARERGVLLLAEIGLDPGIDHMSTMALVDRVHAAGGRVERFESYGGGLPAPDSIANPLHYAVTWNPRNVVMAAEQGAHYLRDGRLKAVPMERVFAQPWSVEVEGLGTFEAYANRDSMAYRRLFGIPESRTLVRGTLRYPGWCHTWLQVVRLGLPTERISVPGLGERSWADLVEMFLPEPGAGADESAPLEERTARFLGLAADDPALAHLRWLGLFSPEPIGAPVATASQALAHLLRRRLTLPAGGRDMVILLHRLGVAWPDGRRERISSLLVEYGEPGGTTAMARTVGLPAALAARLLLTGGIRLAGSRIPTEAAIYRPLLAALEGEGVRFTETVLPAGDPPPAPSRTDKTERSQPS